MTAAATAKRGRSAKGTAETAELRKRTTAAGDEARRTMGQLRKNCGRTAETLSSLSSVAFRTSPGLVPWPAPGLERMARPALPREWCSPAPPTPAPALGAGSALSMVRGLPPHELAVIEAALAVLDAHLRKPGAVLGSPHAVREFLRVRLAGIEREVFGVLWLDAAHAAIGFEVLFEGTLRETAVYPRELVRRALELNAAAVILAHNHPSSTAEPSHADELVTRSCADALRLVDVRILDHLVIGWPAAVSFCERGLL